MYVTRLDADDWTTGQQQNEMIERPDLAGIEAALRRLDGERWTLVVLGTEGDSDTIPDTTPDTTYMGIGGGAGGRYVVFISDDRGESFILRESETDLPEESAVALVIGGQSGEYPARHCVGQEAMLRAARTFAVDGARDTSLAWERQEDDEGDDEGDDAPDLSALGPR
ncbi:MAG: hypothetical protein IVW57_09000 [Ktedonobacterales bacterium]|nr:hypothetical protein [Ktedonobacterales bacterium]